jgi:PPOX class probable F420-dependent enzyme
VDPTECRRLFASVPVVRLATVGLAGPHLVPIVFALDGDRVVTAVDHKPKRSTRLQRLTNIARDPRVSLLADHYDDDWETLWWVRADGRGRLLDDPAGTERALDLLAARYRQYREDRPDGRVVEIAVERWTGWSAGAGAELI